MLSELRFYAAMAYRARPSSALGVVVRDAVLRIKNNTSNRSTGVPACRGFATWLRSQIAGSVIEECFSDVPVLVPVPRRAPLQGGSLWPALEIARGLVAEGFGSAVEPCLVRATAVPKSVLATPGGRPSPQAHQDSCRISPQLVSAGRIVLVDDVISAGSTLLGCASLVADAYPACTVVSFATARAVNDREPTAAFEPCRGWVRIRDDHAHRSDETEGQLQIP